jgi:hypothetical protein
VFAAILAASCDDNPVQFDVQDTDRLVVNPTTMVIPGGRTSDLDVRAVNAGRQPTFADVTWSVTNCGDAASLVVEADPDQLDVQPPGQLLVTAGSQLGSNCVDVSADGVTETVDVTVTVEAVVIDSVIPSALLRAGETATVFPRIIAEDSTSMTPFELSHVVFSSSDEAVATIDATGFVQTLQSGNTNLDVTWVPDSTGVSGLAGLTTFRVGTAALEVVATVPDSAFLDVGDTFGAFAVGDSVNGEVVVVDEFGNVNTDPTEILDIVAVSDAPAIATVEAEIRQTEDPETGEVSARAVMKVFVVGTGFANISGTVTTSEGVFAWGPASILGADPVLTTITPPNGGPAASVTLTGTGFVDGFTTVYAQLSGTDELMILGNYTVDSETQITAQMPTFSIAGTFEIQVEVGGVFSPAQTYTQDVGFVEDATEPNSLPNGDPVAPVSLPLEISGSMVGELVDGFFGGMTDWLEFNLSEDRTIRAVFDWVDGPDKDLYFIDTGFNVFVCGQAGATGAKPEIVTCNVDSTLGGINAIPENYDGVDSAYTISIRVVE